MTARGDFSAGGYAISTLAKDNNGTSRCLSGQNNQHQQHLDNPYKRQSLSVNHTTQTDVKEQRVSRHNLVAKLEKP